LVFNKYYKGRKNMTNQPDGCPIICKGNDSILLSKIGESAFDEDTSTCYVTDLVLDIK